MRIKKVGNWYYVRRGIWPLRSYITAGRNYWFWYSRKDIERYCAFYTREAAAQKIIDYKQWKRDRRVRRWSRFTSTLRDIWRFR